jgi:hypothetical protein
VRSGAVALGEMTCLGAVLGGEHDGVLGFVGGGVGGENPLAGVPPLLSLSDRGGPALSAAVCTAASLRRAARVMGRV